MYVCVCFRLYKTKVGNKINIPCVVWEKWVGVECERVEGLGEGLGGWGDFQGLYSYFCGIACYPIEL